MQSKRKVMISGIVLLVSLSLLLASAVVVYSGSEAKPLACVNCWDCNANDECGEFENTNAGTWADALWARATGGYGLYARTNGDDARAVDAYTDGDDSYGVYARSEDYRAVYGTGRTIGVFGFGRVLSAKGVFGKATGTQAYGVYGEGTYNMGVRGVGGTGGGDYGGYFEGFEGVRGIASGSNGYGLWGEASGTSGYGVYAYASGSSGWAAYFESGNYRGLWADGTSGRYDAWFPDCARIEDTIYGTCASSYSAALTSVIALNNGDLAVEPGDLVAFSGFVTVGGDSEPTLAVQKVNGANSPVVIGVVQSAYVEEGPEEMKPLSAMAAVPPAPEEVDTTPPQREDIPVLPEEPIEVAPEWVAPPVRTERSEPPMAGHFAEGVAAPGQYVTVAVQGITQVKVDASAVPVRAGDMLAASGTGYAINATPAASQPDGASQPRGGAAQSGDRGSPGGPSSPTLTIGRALESLESGTGAIYVFVSVH